MKINILLIGLFIVLFSSCKKENTIQEEPKLAPPQTKSVAITDPNDVNLNVNWKWYDPAVQNVTVYFGQKVNNQPVPGVQASLPWFTAGNPANDVSKDYLPELGWTLYLRDFGTANRPAETPFFALYNKYSGVLRFFVYNYRVRNQGEASKTYYVGELGFKNPANYNELLSFFAPPEKSSVNTIDPSLKQIVVTKKSSSDTWINLDFTLNIRPNNYFNANEAEAAKKILSLNVYGANQSDLNLGTDFSTLTAKSSVGASGSSVSGFADFVKNGYEYLNSGTSLLESIDKLQEKLNGSTTSPITGSTASKSVAAPAAVGTVAAAVGVVKNLFGFVKSFFGGSKSATNTQTTLQYSGIVNTTGTATTTNNLYSVEFNPNYTSALSPSYYVPIYKQPIGVFALPNKDTYLFTDEILYPYCYDWALPDLGVVSTVQHFLTRADFDPMRYSHKPYNQNASTRLDSVNVIMFNNNVFLGKGTFPNTNNTFYKLPAQDFGNYNGGINYDSDRLKWKTIIPGSTDIVALGLLYYATNAMPNYGQSPNTVPQYIGLEIKYTIVDPNYPKQDSKERIIYKVIKLAPRVTRDPARQGCAPRPSGSW